MPILKISDGEGNIPTQALLNLPAVMLFPENETARKQYVAAAALDLLKNHRRPEQDSHFPVTPLKILELISEGPNRDELNQRVDERIGQGRVAANILRVVLSLSRFAPAHATVRKAIRVVGVHLAREEKKIRRPIPASPATLKSVWTRFKPVSHLWAAVPPDFVEYARGARVFSNPLNSRDVDAVIDHVLKFLALAEKIRLRGENHFALGGRTNSSAHKTPTLDPDTTWKAPLDLVLPAVEDGIGRLPDWVMEELKRYKVDP